MVRQLHLGKGWGYGWANLNCRPVTGRKLQFHCMKLRLITCPSTTLTSEHWHWT